MNPFIRIYLGLLIWFYLIVIALMLMGRITFGAGLGDLFYMMMLGLAMLAISGVYFFTRRVDFGQQRIAATAILVIGVLMMVYTVYEFTLGRDAEYLWNGCITYGCGNY